MKAFLLVCLAVAIKAEADPQLLLNTPLVGSHIVGSPIVSSPIISSLPVTSYIAGQPLVQLAEKKPVEEKKVEVEVESYSAEPEKKIEIPSIYAAQPIASAWPYATPLTYAAPVVQNLKVVPRYQAKNGEVEHTVYKREADPQMLINSQWASPIISAVRPAVYSHAVAQPAIYSAAVASPIVYANPAMNVQGVNAEGKTVNKNLNVFPRYVAQSAGATHVVKREADAQLIASPLAYNLATPSIYNNWALPSVYSNIAPVALPWGSKTVANDRIKNVDYAGKGQGASVSPGAIHVYKRSADADAQVLLSARSVLPSVYSPIARPAVYSSSLLRPAVYSSAFRPAVYSGLYY